MFSGFFMAGTVEMRVPTIACGGCVDAIAAAVRDRDPQATVTGDVATKRITVESAVLSAAAVADAIAAAGHDVEA
jgi:copper chaperone